MGVVRYILHDLGVGSCSVIPFTDWAHNAYSVLFEKS